MSNSQIRSYGVKKQTPSGDLISQAVEHLGLVGFAVVDSGYSTEEQRFIANAFSRAFERQAEIHGGADSLKEIDEHNTIRAPLLYDDLFVQLACNRNVLSVAEALFGGSHETGTYILNQQNGIVNPAGGQTYNQALFHRDLPYQHFVSSRPLAINALYCIDPFTVENGATQVLPGSHKQEAFPSDDVVQALTQPVEAPAGSFLILDCMVYHAGGTNRTDHVRRAVNHVYTIPMIRQQIELAAAMPSDRDIDSETWKLLGANFPSLTSVGSFYEGRRSKMAPSKP